MRYATVTFIMLFCLNRTFAYLIPLLVGSGIGGLLSKPLYCFWKECCQDRWIPHNVTGLKAELNEKVFGQHIALEVVYKAIKGHVKNKNPSKALVLSFHGWTGCGKNHVSKIIADSLYKKGMKSMYTHQVIATHDFPHMGKVSTYREELQKYITERVKQCPRSLFIFDEVDKIPPGLMDILRPFLEHHQDVGGVDYRKSIFIFLSNTGANMINNYVLSHWRQGNKREDLTIKDMDPIINNGAFNMKGGLRHSDLILHNLIDYFVPFLPLEKFHVKKCIIADLILKEKPHTDDIVNAIANSMQYNQEKVFSKTGCKKVSSKVDQIVD